MGCMDVDTCGCPTKWITDDGNACDFLGYRTALLDGFRRELDRVDRSETPWLVVTSHYPFYQTGLTDPKADAAEPDGGARGRPAHEREREREHGRSSPEPSIDQARLDLEPLLVEFKADLYFYGHWHYYGQSEDHNRAPSDRSFSFLTVPMSETTWPVINGTVTSKSFVDPTAPVHVCSGAAGPPEWDSFSDDPEPWSREPRLTGTTYSRVVLHNASVLEFEDSQR